MYDAKSGAQEVSNVLDGASAILSQKGGNGLLSVRSGYLSTLSSVKTPRSKMSSVSIIHSAGRHEWSKYRSRNKKEKLATVDDIFTSPSRIPGRDAGGSVERIQKPSQPALSSSKLDKIV